MKALNSGKERVVAATVGSLLQYLARTGYSTFGGRDTDGNVLAISHLSMQRLALALVITCVIAITVALFPVDGSVQTPPNNAATGAPSITGAARVGQSLTVDTSGVADADGNTKAENGDAGFAYTFKWFRVDSDGTSNKTEITGQTALANFVDTEGKSCRDECEVTVTITDNDAEKVCFEDDADDMAVCQQIPLAVGENTVKVKVTAGDFVTTRTYTVVVTRGNAPELVVNHSMLEIDEASSGTFTVKLTSPPTANVSVSISSDNVGAATVSPADLIFTPSGLNDTQTVTVCGESDDDADNESLTVEFDEGGAQEIEVTLSADPEREVVIHLNASGQDGASHQDFSGMRAWLKFGPGETSKIFSFPATQDFDDYDGESVIITFGDLPSGVSRGVKDTTTVDIIDDEFGDPGFNLGTLGAYWTHTDDADGNLLVGTCTGSGSFIIIWSAREDRRGADEWLARITSHGDFRSGRRSFRESLVSLPGLYEINGTLEMRGEGSLTIRVRGRFGDIWDTWPPPVILFCLPSLDRGQ